MVNCKKYRIKSLYDNKLKYENYKEATDAGIFCYLMDAPHNQYYQVGHRRIYNLDIPIK